MSDARAQLLHPLTGAPLPPVGYRRNGKPIWPILGAAETDDSSDEGDDAGDDDADGDDTGDDDSSDEGESGLGDAGKKALDRMKAERNAARKKARDLARENAVLKKPKPDDQDKPDPTAIREEARAEARAEVMRDRVMDKIEAKAAKFADPDDAVAILMRTHEADDFLTDGKIDVQEIEEALDDLLEKKPHLAAQGGKRKPAPDSSQGARPGSEPKAQLKREDLVGMDPDDIVKAKAEGRLNDVLGIK